MRSVLSLLFILFFGERRLGTDLANVEEETSCGVVEERSKSDPGSVEESSL